MCLRKHTPTSCEAGVGTAGAAGARGGEEVPTTGPPEVLRVRPAWEGGSGHGKESPPGLRTKGPATAIATGF